MANKLVQRLCLMYGPPETENIDAWFAEMDRLLKGYREDILDKAADLIFRTHKRVGFPPLSVIVTACVDTAEGMATFKKLKPEDYHKKLVDPEQAKALLAGFSKSMEEKNTFRDITARCSAVGSTIDLTRPWGEEVHDRNGNIVPIRKRSEAA